VAAVTNDAPRARHRSDQSPATGGILVLVGVVVIGISVLVGVIHQMITS